MLTKTLVTEVMRTYKVMWRHTWLVADCEDSGTLAVSCHKVRISFVLNEWEQWCLQAAGLHVTLEIHSWAEQQALHSSTGRSASLGNSNIGAGFENRVHADSVVLWGSIDKSCKKRVIGKIRNILKDQVTKHNARIIMNLKTAWYYVYFAHSNKIA